jgi:hypothetical protein
MAREHLANNQCFVISRLSWGNELEVFFAGLYCNVVAPALVSAVTPARQL